MELEGGEVATRKGVFGHDTATGREGSGGRMELQGYDRYLRGVVQENELDLVLDRQ
jgi:hypothetical protein